MPLQRIQIGYESAGVRVTPIDQSLGGLPDSLTAIIKLAVGLIDSRDIQPGDGEIDIPLDPKTRAQIARVLGPLGHLIPDHGNIFLKVKS